MLRVIGRNFLAKNFKNTANDLTCFSACTLHDVKEQEAVQNVVAKADIGLTKNQKKFLFQFFKKVGFKINFLSTNKCILQVGLKEELTDREREDCKRCYKSTDCKDGYKKGPHSGYCYEITGLLTDHHKTKRLYILQRLMKSPHVRLKKKIQTEGLET